MRNLIVLLIVLFLAPSCSKDISDLNKDVKNASVVEGQTLFSNAQKGLADQMVSTSVYKNVFRLFAQYWTQTTYNQESNFELGTASVPTGVWKSMFKVLKDLDEAKKLIAQDVNPINAETNKNKLAVIEVLNVYTFKTLVDIFGNIPYYQSLSVDDPAYDDAESIYLDLVKRLNGAILSLNPAYDSFGTADLYYGGKVEKWLKLANSIKLEMGLLLNKQDLVSQAAAGVMLSNADNTQLNYLLAPPNTNPLWLDLVQSGREDYVVANTVVDILGTLNDPRRKYFFADNLQPYTGGVYGANNTYNLFTHINAKMKDPTLPGVIFSYSQVEFYLAEAAERSMVGNPSMAKAHYDKAVIASTESWGGTRQEALDYLAGAASYNVQKTWQEKIGTQTWIANYNRGLEGWTSWRRFDFPKLNIPMLSKRPVPMRFTYPITEQTLNGKHYEEAAAAMGGDLQKSKIFWDK